MEYFLRTANLSRVGVDFKNYEMPCTRVQPYPHVCTSVNKYSSRKVKSNEIRRHDKSKVQDSSPTISNRLFGITEQ